MELQTLNQKSTLLMNAEAGLQNATLSWEALAFNCNFRIGKLAQVCQVSVRTLQRHFRKHYDLTMREWLREVRLEKSRSMLPEAGCVKTVAYELGYKQPSHFTRDFKQRYGVPPKMWLLADAQGASVLLQEPPSEPVMIRRHAGNAQSADLFANC
jgi:AraC-like DNA-binding protein